MKDKIILTERDKKIFLDAINNPPEPNEELMKFYKEYKDINNMKKNVSIKFNSIKEYREIEKKLIELGYKDDKLLGLKTKDCIEVKINDDKTFTPLLFTFPTYITYNSLQEFLKDENSNL